MKKPVLRIKYPNGVIAAVRNSMVVGIRAGGGKHRFIGIWAVVVEGRIFVRSWSLKPTGWYHTFLKKPIGTLQVAGRSVDVRAVRTRSTRLKDAVDKAYLKKYSTPGSLRFSRGLATTKRKATTTELKLLTRR